MNIIGQRHRKPAQETITQRLMGESYLPSRNRVFNLIDRLQGNKPETDQFTYEDMARMAGLSRPTYARALKDMVDEGLVIIVRHYDEAKQRAANTYRIVRQSFADLREVLKLKKIREASRRRMLAKLADKRRKLSLTDETTSITIPKMQNESIPERGTPAWHEWMAALPSAEKKPDRLPDQWGRLAFAI